MKLLVLGATGMAGHVIATFLKEQGHDVETLASKSKLDDSTHIVDVLNHDELISNLGRQPYDAVINCIGLLVNDCEKYKDKAVYINAYLPHVLENYFRKSDTKVIYISSDGVFSESLTERTEESNYDATSFYGRTKALGEIINKKDLTFRMSIIGPTLKKDGTGLFNWFWLQRGYIDGYTNVFWNGVTTLELAKAIEEALKQGVAGIYHLVSAKPISKNDLLKMFKTEFNRTDIKVGSATSSGTNSVLRNTRTDFEFLIPDYKKMINDMKAWIENHPNFYGHYLDESN